MRMKHLGSGSNRFSGRSLAVVAASCALVLGLGVSVAGTGAVAGAARSTGTVKIGEIQDLSGNCAAPGVPFALGMKIAVNNINKKGFIVAGKKYKLKPTVLDGATNNTTAVTALNSLVKDKGIKMVFGPGCGSYNEPGVSPLSQKLGILLMQAFQQSTFETPSTGVKFANGAGYLLASMQASGTDSGAAQASLIKKFPNSSSIKKVSLLLEDDGEGHYFGTSLEAWFTAHGITPTVTYYPTTTQDFSGFLSSIKAASTDLLMYGYGDPSGLAILKQAQALNVAPRYYGYGTSITDATGVNGAAGISGDQVSLEYVRSVLYPDTPALKAFAKQVKAANGGALPADSSYTTYGYDWPGLLVAAMQKAKTTTNLRKIAKALYSIHYKGLDSPNEFFDSTHHLHFQIDGCLVASGANPTSHVTCSPVLQ
jgi:branched-chain amino acid transport system substrate-binding protein